MSTYQEDMQDSQPDQDEKANMSQANRQKIAVKSDSEAATPVPERPELAFPWYTRYGTLVGCFFLQGLTSGCVHAWGIQQEYLEENDFAGDDSKIRSLSYIGTLMYSQLYLWGIVSGWLAEVWSYRRVCYVGILIMTAGLVLSSFCKEPWQYCMTQGIMWGFGAGMIFGPTSTAPIRWFTKHRGLATGISVSGVGIGGLIVSPLTEYLVHNLGVHWCGRVAAMYTFVIGTIAVYLVRVPFQDKTRTLKSFNWGMFRNRRFVVHSAMVCFVTAAYITPYTFWPTFWTDYGLTTKNASALISIGNAASALGRILVGIMADRIGVINSLLLATILSTISMMAIWPFAKNMGVSIVMVLIYGFEAGSYWTLAPLSAAKLFGVDCLASSAGILYTISATSAWLGNPVATALLEKGGDTKGSRFLGLIMYIGALWALAFIFALINRLSYSKKLFYKA